MKNCKDLSRIFEKMNSSYRFITTTVFMMSLVLTSACRVNVLHGEGQKGTHSFPVGSFSKINISFPVTASITVQEGSNQSVQLDGYENIIKHIKVTVEGQTLIISSDMEDSWNMSDNADVKATITVPSIVKLSTSGAAEVNMHGNITGQEFKMDLSGASKVVIDNINVDQFTTGVSGATSIEVKGGNVKHADYGISGASKINAFPLQAADLVLSVSGASNCRVTAIEKLSVNVSGASSVRYKGHPSVTQDVSGASSISNEN